jgi:hypothetical protein
MRRPKRVGSGAYWGGVGVGGRKSVTLRYRKEANKDYPFMQPGVDKAKPKIQQVYNDAWAKATKV